ncbi:TlpA family protein disulfide reductase [Thermovibrio sp.]
MGFHLLALLLALLTSSPALADWYILIPKEKRPVKRGAPLPKISGGSKKEKKKVKPYSVEVRKVLAPSFTLYTPDGVKLTKDELSGRPVVFLFVKELFSPYTERLAKEFEELSRKGALFIVVDVDDADFIAARSFKRLLNLKRVIVTADSYLFSQFKINVRELSVPSIVVVDRYGFVRFFSPKLSSKEPEVVKKEVEEILKGLERA